MLGEIDAFFSLIDRFKKRFNKDKPDSDSVATRFLRLFENHGVHRNQIPRFFGHNLKITDVQTDDSLLKVLNDKMLQRAADMFAVQREWLDGASQQIYPLHDFYKNPEDFVAFIEKLNTDKSELHGVLIIPETDKREPYALIVLEEKIGTINDRPVYRYHICNNWLFSYWKARAYLTACVAAAWKRNVYIMGRKVPVELIQRYGEGEEFLEYSYGDALPTQGKHWYPEDMVSNPDVYLDGVTEGEFGRSSALQMWLRLEEQGYMDAGFPGSNDRAVFERVLQGMNIA